MPIERFAKKRFKKKRKQLAKPSLRIDQALGKQSTDQDLFV